MRIYIYIFFIKTFFSLVVLKSFGLLFQNFPTYLVTCLGVCLVAGVRLAEGHLGLAAAGCHAVEDNKEGRTCSTSLSKG